MQDRIMAPLGIQSCNEDRNSDNEFLGFGEHDLEKRKCGKEAAESQLVSYPAYLCFK